MRFDGKLGAEPKKIALLATVVVLGGFAVYSSWSSDLPKNPVSAVKTADSQVDAATKTLNLARPDRRPIPGRSRQVASGPPVRGQRGGVQDFHVSLKEIIESNPDLTTSDPTLKLPLLVRLREVELNETRRSLFEFSAKPVEAPKGPGGKGLPVNVAVAPTPPPTPVTPPPIPKPPPPPIPLKFYGFVNSSRGGAKRAFFLDGEDIFVAGEGETVKGRYRIIRIGLNSALVEDLPNQNQQQLPLVEEFNG